VQRWLKVRFVKAQPGDGLTQEMKKHNGCPRSRKSPGRDRFYDAERLSEIAEPDWGLR